MPMANGAPKQPNVYLQTGKAETVPNARDLSIKDWLRHVDDQWLRHVPAPHPTCGVRDYISAVESQFDSLQQIIDIYVTKGSDGVSIMDDTFFDDIGMKKVGHKRIL